MVKNKRLSVQEEGINKFRERTLSAIKRLMQYFLLYSILILLEIIFCVWIKRQNIQETMQHFFYSTFFVNCFVLLLEILIEFILNIKSCINKLNGLLANKNNILLIIILFLITIVFILDIVTYTLLKIDYLEIENESYMCLLCVGLAISDIVFAICLNDLKENQEALK